MYILALILYPTNRDQWKGPFFGMYLLIFYLKNANQKFSHTTLLGALLPGEGGGGGESPQSFSSITFERGIMNRCGV